MIPFEMSELLKYFAIFFIIEWKEFSDISGFEAFI